MEEQAGMRRLLDRLRRRKEAERLTAGEQWQRFIELAAGGHEDDVDENVLLAVAEALGKTVEVFEAEVGQAIQKAQLVERLRALPQAERAVREAVVAKRELEAEIKQQRERDQADLARLEAVHRQAAHALEALRQDETRLRALDPAFAAADGAPKQADGELRRARTRLDEARADLHRWQQGNQAGTAEERAVRRRQREQAVEQAEAAVAEHEQQLEQARAARTAARSELGIEVVN